VFAWDTAKAAQASEIVPASEEMHMADAGAADAPKVSASDDPQHPAAAQHNGSAAVQLTEQQQEGKPTGASETVPVATGAGRSADHSHPVAPEAQQNRC